MNSKTVVAALVLGAMIASCKNNNSGGARQSFCDTICMTDSIKLADSSSKLKPYIYISAKNCAGDTLTWGYTGQNKNIPFNYRLNKEYTRCFFKDTSFALLLFNTCEHGRGYFIKFSFGKKASYTKSTSAINNFDPKFVVDNSLLAYTDMGNLFVEDMQTEKKALLTFGQQLNFDFDAIHETLDSVNISPSRIWAKAKVNGEWKVFEKQITPQ